MALLWDFTVKNQRSIQYKKTLLIYLIRSVLIFNPLSEYHFLGVWEFCIARKDEFCKNNKQKEPWGIGMAWVPIERHVPIIYNYSPFNKELIGYFEKRDIKEFNRNNVAYRQKLAKKQKYKCSLCTHFIADFSEELETHHKIPKIKGGSNEYRNLQLVHKSCHILYHRLFPAKGPIPTDKQLLAAKKYLYKSQIGRHHITKTLG